MRVLKALFGLTAVISTVSALQKPRQEEFAGYGFVYFIGEKYANGEQIYFAVSEGNSPGSWSLVNGGAPALNSTLGDAGVRDPYIIQHPDTGVFYVIATDLKVYGSGKSWDYLSRHGSLSLAIWESTDLVNWSDERLVQVSPPEAGMSWAPEATWDPVAQHFVVYWASNLFAAADTNHTGATYARQLAANTTDFITFTEAAIWIDRGTANIDTTICLDPVTQYYHRFSKTSGKVLQERSTSLFGTWEVIVDGIAYGEHREVEGPLCFYDNLDSTLAHVWVDDIADLAGETQGYLPYQSNNITTGVWDDSADYVLPKDPRHGTVIPLTASQMSNLVSLTAP